jgi:hypothetical protein
VIALVISIVFLRQRDRRLQARAIKWLGFGIIAVFSVLAGLFIAGEAFEEPEGTGAIITVLAWLIPLVGLAGLAWFRPRLAAPIMIALSGAVVLASLWFAVDPDVWRVIEDPYGPVRAVAVFLLSAAVGVLGLRGLSSQAGFWSLLVCSRAQPQVWAASPGRSHFRSSALSR